MIGPGFFLIVLTVSTAITLYFLIRSRHIENMARIEHGFPPENDKGRYGFLLHLGLFCCSLGSGFLLAYFLTVTTSLPEYIAFPTCLLFSGGMGLIAIYLINTNRPR